jgi:putative colanic acid biosysnthesis UDP-glucose lipid carrier transferase
LKSTGPLAERSSGIAILQRAFDALIIVGVLNAILFAFHVERSVGYTLASVLAVSGYLLVAEFNHLYRWNVSAQMAGGAIPMGMTWLAVLCGLVVLGFITKTSTSFSRLAVTTWALATPIVLTIWRLLLRGILRNFRLRGVQTSTVAIAGCTSTTKSLLENIVADPTLGFIVRGIYDDRAQSRRHVGAEQLAPIIGNLERLVEDTRNGLIDVVCIALPLRAETRAAQLVRRLADTTATVYYVPDFFVFDLLHARWGAIGDVSILSIFDTPFQGFGGWVKRLEDVVLGTFALILLAPLMVLIAIGVRISSAGPVLFRQRRHGLSGREIYVYKFRTMTTCEDGNNVRQAQRGDARITRFGSFLRRTSLDELPQLLNVIGGSMSLVGPRPHAIVHNELYRDKIHGYMLRHKVKPGITGWAQVNGWRGETNTIDKMEKRVQHDLQYIHRWSIGLDLRILFLTVFGKRVRQNAR